MTTSQLPVGKVVCVGRNYADHAKELGNEVPTSPILFMKPASSIRHVSKNIVLPQGLGDCHYECELCVQLGKPLINAGLADVKQAISGVTLGLDLTLREVQNQLKAKGHPWERAKAFDGSCVLADWQDPASFTDFTQVRYQFLVNDYVKQDGDTAFMLFPVYELLIEISHAFSLQAGDVIMTGTPSGVGALHAGDKLTLVLQGQQIAQLQVGQA